MPPQQPDRLLDILDEGLDFRAHDVPSDRPSRAAIID
jgi:hypothetical protein